MTVPRADTFSIAILSRAGARAVISARSLLVVSPIVTAALYVAWRSCPAESRDWLGQPGDIAVTPWGSSP